MADEVDAAQWVNELHLRDALANHHRRADEIRATHGRSDCEDCGEEIPLRRRQAVPGCRLCVECQRALEMTREKGCNGD